MGDKKTKTKPTKAEEIKQLKADMAKVLKENERLKKSASDDKPKAKTFDERVQEGVDAIMNKISEDNYRKNALEGLSEEEQKNEKLITARVDALRAKVEAGAVTKVTKQVNKEIAKERTVSEFDSAKAKAVEAGLPQAIADKATSASELALAQETFEEMNKKSGKKTKDSSESEEVDDMDTDVGSGGEDESEGDDDDTDYGASADTELFAKLGAAEPGSKEYNETLNALNGVS